MKGGMPRARLRPTGILLLALGLVACQGNPAASGNRPRPNGNLAALASPKPATLPSGAAGSLAGAALRVLSGDAAGLLSNHGGGLIGKVKVPSGIIANHGSSLISNNGSAVRVAGEAKLISDAGGGLLSNHGGGLQGAGSGLISNNGSAYALLGLGRGLAQAEGDRPVEGVLVAVVDAEGRVLADEQGQAYAVRTDAQGAYRFDRTPIGRNLILAVAMPESVGPMLAFLPDAAASASRPAVEVTGVSTLAMGYVLRQFVANQAQPTEVLQRLPAQEEAKTREALLAAGGSGADLGSFLAQGVVAKVEALQAQAPALKAQVDLVKQLLVAGLSNAGDGRKATEVALSSPKGMLRLADGSLLLVERNGGRIRRLLKDGTITSFAGKDGGTDPVDGMPAGDARLLLPSWLAQGPNGRIYLTLYGQHQLVAIEADGRLKVLAGSGVQEGHATALPAAGTPARSYALKNPQQVTVDAEGRAVFNVKQGVLRLEADGSLTPLGFPADGGSAPEGLWTDAQGQVWGWGHEQGRAYRLQGSAFVDAPGVPRLPTDKSARLKPLPDGGLVMTNLDQVLVWAPGQSAWKALPFTTDHGEVQEVLVEGQTLLLGDNTSNKVWSLPLVGGAATVLAGLPSTLPPDVLDGANLALNRPSSLVLDGEGRLLVADALNGVIWRRSDDGRYQRFAGGIPLEVGQSFQDEGRPAREARLGKIIGMSLEANGDLLFTDLLPSAAAIRRVQADGTVRSVPIPEGLAAPAGILPLPDGSWLVSDYLLGQLLLWRPGQKAVALHPTVLKDPGAICRATDGSVYVPLREDDAVYRLGPDYAQAPVLVAGGQGRGFAGDGGPAKQAKLFGPIYTLLDGRGGLLISDVGNDRVRRVDLASGLIRTLVGQGGVALTSTGVDGGLKQPTGLVFGPKGELYVADSGNNQVKVVPASALP